MHKTYACVLIPGVLLLLAMALVGCGSESADKAVATDKTQEQKTKTADPNTAEAGVSDEPATKVSETPGAPLVIGEVREQSTDTPPNVPGLDPIVTTPSVIKTPIPTQLVGLTFSESETDGLVDSNGTVVFGNGGNARNIVFIVDATGSMVDVLPFAIDGVKDIVKSLSPQQNITILVFSGEGIYEVPGGGGVKGLRPATPEFKESINEWISLGDAKFEAGGPAGDNAEHVILRALSYKPEIVFVLSDTLVDGSSTTRLEIARDKLIKAISKANDKHRVKINALHFLNKDPLDQAGMTGTLRKIAELTGGHYRYLSAKDLNLE